MFSGAIVLADAGGALGVALVSIIIFIAIATVIGAVFLRGGIWLYNKFVGGPEAASGVPEPDFGKAMLITFVTMLAKTGVEIVLRLAQVSPSMALLSWVLGLVINAALLAAMLPTTFARGILVTLCEFLLILLILGGILLILFQMGVVKGLFG